MPFTVGVDQINSSMPVAGNDQIASRNTVDKDEFLRLFVTRLANQDPLSPMDDNQFIGQMAQFSQLEQLQNMNDNLAQSLNSNVMLSQTINNTMATSLLGRTVRVDSNNVVLRDSGSATVRYDVDQPAADVVIEISNQDGALVRVLRQTGAVGGANEVEWDGKDSGGNRLPEGSYNLKIRAEDADGNAVTAHGYFTGEVDSVRYVDGNAMLTVGKALIPLSDVIQVKLSDG